MLTYAEVKTIQLDISQAFKGNQGIVIFPYLNTDMQEVLPHLPITALPFQSFFHDYMSIAPTNCVSWNIDLR